MTYMTSTASNAGVVDITVYFKQGTDPDMAAVNVQIVYPRRPDSFLPK